MDHGKKSNLATPNTQPNESLYTRSERGLVNAYRREEPRERRLRHKRTQSDANLTSQAPLARLAMGRRDDHPGARGLFLDPPVQTLRE